MADIKIIYKLLEEVRDDQKDANKKSQEHREDSIKWHTETNSRLDRYNEQLEVHIEGVKTLKQLHADNVKRIENLERPSQTLDTIKKWAGGVTVVLGAVYAVAKLNGLM